MDVAAELHNYLAKVRNGTAKQGQTRRQGPKAAKIKEYLSGQSSREQVWLYGSQFDVVPILHRHYCLV
jgi:hypothetical protein